MTVRNYFLPRSLAEALGLLETRGQSLLVMAGGTVAMPLINEGISLPEEVMGLRNAGLDTLEADDGELRIGATATLTQLIAQGEIGMLRDAARSTASWSIRNMGTVGGNLFTPPPGGDVAVALLALDAKVGLAGPKGARFLPLKDFYTGFMTNQLRDDELLAEIRVARPAGETAFVKHGRKHENTPAVVTVAIHLTRADGAVSSARIALGAVGPRPIRALRAEQSLVGSELGPDTIANAAATAADECEAFSDGVASDWYRRRMVKVFVARALERLVASGEGEGS